jgi:SH3-like domain-containing protein
MPVFSEIDRTLRNITCKHVLSVTVILLLLSILPSTLRAAMVSIKGDKVNLRSGPGTNYSVSWELGEGYPLKILEKKKSWLKVRDFEGDTGWVYRKLTANRPHLIVKKELVNIRKTPSTRGRIIGKANYGVVFTTIKQQSGWAKVKHDSGLVGWIKRDLLWGW